MSSQPITSAEYQSFFPEPTTLSKVGLLGEHTVTDESREPDEVKVDVVPKKQKGSEFPEARMCVQGKALPKALKSFGDYTLTIDKIVALASVLFLITTMFYQGALSGRFHQVLKDLGYLRSALAIMMIAGAIIKVYEGIKRWHDIAKNKDLDGNAKYLAHMYAFTSLSQEVINVLRAGMCAVAALWFRYMPTDGASIVAGAFPHLTLGKHSFALGQATLEHMGAKKHATGKEDKTHRGTTMLSGVVAVGEVALALPKICNVVLENFIGKVGTASLMLIVACASVFQRWKSHTNSVEKEEFVESELEKLRKEAKGKERRVEQQGVDERREKEIRVTATPSSTQDTVGWVHV